MDRYFRRYDLCADSPRLPRSFLQSRLPGLFWLQNSQQGDGWITELLEDVYFLFQVMQLATRLSYCKANYFFVNFEVRTTDRYQLPYTNRELFHMLQVCDELFMTVSFFNYIFFHKIFHHLKVLMFRVENVQIRLILSQ